MAYGTQYSWVVTLIKGLVAGGGVGGVGLVFAWIGRGMTSGDFTLSAEESAALAAAAGLAWVAAKNFAKHKLGWKWLPVIACATASLGGF